MLWKSREREKERLERCGRGILRGEMRGSGEFGVIFWGVYFEVSV